MANIRLLIAEDQNMVRGALSALLTLSGHFEVVFEAANGDDAFTFAYQNTVDIVLTDIEMPGRSGLELAADLFSRLEAPPKLVLLSTFSRLGYVARARALGIQGYLLKESPSDELARALRKIMRGQIVYDATIEANESVGLDPLSDKERQILRLAEQGATTADIARQVHRTEGTVRNVLSDVIKRLSVVNRTEAIREARKNGWL